MLFRLLASSSLIALCLIAQNEVVPNGPFPKDLENKDIKLGEDEPGCKDSTLVPRLAGCSIIQCDSRETGTLELTVGASTEGVIQKELMDGPNETLYYLCPSKLSLPAIVKQSDAALVKAGFKTVFNGKDDDDQPLVTTLKENQWVQVSTYMYNEYSAYIVTTVQDTPDSQATSELLVDEMTKNGRVILTGLSFDTKKPDLPDDAEKVLSEVHQLLLRQPTWKIRVEGHNNDLADKQANMTLSQQRASAVASWLLEHGIDQSRVSIQGYGDSKPSSEAPNPRIEIVKF
jgi:outer membrane protein OmpA-like peptidoglycan-associated protein